MRRLLVGLLPVFTLLGADFTGIWIGEVPVRNGTQDVAFKITQKDTTVTGKLYGDFRSTPILEGVAAGEEIIFVVVAEEQAGNQINQTRLRFTGTLKDGVIEMTRERETATNAGNGGVVQFRGNTKTTFRLRRLL
jgi:hypothetical protein